MVGEFGSGWCAVHPSGYVCDVCGKPKLYDQSKAATHLVSDGKVTNVICPECMQRGILWAVQQAYMEQYTDPVE